MRILKSAVEQLISRGIARSLNGDPRRLRRLLQIPKIGRPGPAFAAFLNRLSEDLESGGMLSTMLLHLGRSANGVQKRKLAQNLILNWAVKGARIRTTQSTLERWIPFFVVVSPSMRCNLHCTGCYSALYSKEGELTEAELDRIFSECEEMGAYFSVVSGGEPYLMSDVLLRLFRKHKDMFFLTFTNGTLLDEPLVRTLAQLGNVAPAISVEGYEDHTDRRRSAGVYKEAMRAMDLLRKYGVLFGISVTYTRENIDLVTEDAFIDYYVHKGATFGWYFMFMPIGRDPVLDLVPSPDQRLECGRRVAGLRRRHPIFLADFWNDGATIGGCLAGGRRYLHILNSGRVEPCVFAHFGADNIKEKSILEAANSPFFRAIRREFPYSEDGNLKRPCMIIDNPEVLTRLVDEYLAPAGHQHAEDMLHDPAVRRWVRDYADRMKVLTDEKWKAMIEDPASRWHKEKPEYKNMFRFKPMPKPPSPAKGSLKTGSESTD